MIAAPGLWPTAARSPGASFSSTGRPFLAELRTSQGLDPDPMAACARSGYDQRIVAERVGGTQAGWGA
jgi:L-rhamnose isomerase/sugar isomerase